MAIRLPHRVLVALLGLVLGWHLAGAQEPSPRPEEPLDDPFPIRRVLLPKDRLAAELERVKQGVFRQLKRKEFEDRVRLAAVGARRAPTLPRLVQAKYYAKLAQEGWENNALIGTAEWKIVHAGVGTALLPLDALQIALREARWTDNRPALIGHLDPRPQAGLGLLVESPGEHSLALAWSSRGISETGELRFDLAVPTSPLATLELTLPSGVSPIFPQDDVLANGPVPIANDDDHCTWSISFGGLTHLEFRLRPAQPADAKPPVILSAAATRQDLSTGLLQHLSTFEFQVPRGDVTDLIVEYDPDLAITDVSVLNLDYWSPLKDGGNGRKRIQIHLSEPARGGQLRVAASGPLPATETLTWNSPAMQIVNAIPRGETIRLKLGPDLHLIEWRAGTFRLLNSEWSADRSHKLFLESFPTTDAQPTAVRPSARFRPPGTAFRVQQMLDWTIEPDQSTLTSRLAITVARGTCSQVSFRVPTGWDVAKVEQGANESNLDWAVTPGAQPILRVTLPRPLTLETAAALVIHLRQPSLGLSPRNRQLIPFPDLAPIGAAARQGEYRVHVSPAFRAFAPAPIELSDSVGPPIPLIRDAAAIWRYHYHGLPPAGPLLLSARTPRFAVENDSIVTLENGRPRVVTRLLLTPETGAAASIIVATTEPLASTWNWRTRQGTNQVVAVKPIKLGLLGSLVSAKGPFDLLRLRSDALENRWFRLDFARPLDTPLELEIEYQLPVQGESPDRERWSDWASLSAWPIMSPLFIRALLPFRPIEDGQSLPLLRVLGAVNSIELVTVILPEASGKRPQVEGLRLDSVRSVAQDRHAYYRYTDGTPVLKLVPGATVDRTARSRVDGAELTTVASSDDSYTCLFRFRIRNGPRPNLPVHLPPGALLREVAVAGQPLMPDQFPVAADDPTRCWIPVLDGQDWQRIDILYTIPAPSWRLATRLKAPLPELPVPMGDIRLLWRFPPEIMPILRESLSTRPGGPSTDRGHFVFFPTRNDDPVRTDGRERPVPEPTAKAKGSGASNRVFRQLLVGPGSPTEKPIVDRLALAEAGWEPATPIAGVGVPTWDSLGLVLVTLPNGTVLTTPRQRSIWYANGSDHAFPTAVVQAMDEAIRSGRDASGRFLNVADWLESRAPLSPFFRELGGDGPGWTEWEATSGPMLLVADTTHVAIAGWLITALLLVVALLGIGYSNRRRSLLLLLWLLGAGTAWISLPSALSGLAAGPLLCGLVFAILHVWHPQAPPSTEQRTEIQHRSTRNRVAMIGSASVIVIVSLLRLSATAQGPEAATVYLIPGTTAEAEPRGVLVPPELLERLNLLAHPRAPVPDAVILRAEYIGRGEANGSAEFEGRFDVFSFTDRATIALPLGEVRLREVLLGGANAFPKSSATDRITIDLKEKGEHRLVVKFSVAVTGTGPDRDVRFSTPELAICHLAFTAPPGARRPRALNWRGAQSVGDDGKKVEADLGRARSVHVRWQQEGATGNVQVRVQEASVWDIAPLAATLYSVFDYRITQGSVAVLKIQLPPNVDVSRLEVRPEAASGGLPLAAIRDWSINANRVLEIELQAALGGSVRLLLEAVPIKSLLLRPPLQVPTAVDANESEAHLAFRLHDLTSSTDFEKRGVADFSADSFLKDIWRPAGGEKAPAAVTRAFRRTRNDTPFLRPVLQASRPVARAAQELVWGLGPRQADVRGSAAWTSAGEPLTFVEWEVPASITIYDVRGIHLHSWLRSANRVIAWLREPAPETTVIWHGGLPRGNPTAETIQIDLPPIRLEGAAVSVTTLRLRVPDGWIATPENSTGWGEPVPALQDGERALEWKKPLAPLPLRVLLRGPQPGATFHVLRTAEVAGLNLNASIFIDTSLRRDRPHAFRLRVRNATGWQPSVFTPADCLARALAAPAGILEWRIDVPPRENEDLPIEIRFQRPLANTGEFLLPVLEIDQGETPPTVETRLWLVGPEIRERVVNGLQRDEERNDAAWPVQGEQLKIRGGSRWRVTSGDNLMRIVAAPLPLGTTPAVRIRLANAEAARAGDRWIYRASIDLTHEADAALSATLPAGLRWEAASLDGNDLSINLTGVLAIPLPRTSGIRLLQLAWTSRDPRWELPRLESAGRSIVPDVLLWTAMAPIQDRLEVDRSLSPAAMHLRRAEIQLGIASDLMATPESSAGLVERAWQEFRLADAYLKGPLPGRADERGPEGQSLPEWSTRLRERLTALRAERPKNDAQPAPTFDSFPDADSFRSGIPIHWEVATAGPAVTPTWRRSVQASSLPLLATFGLYGVGLLLLSLLWLALRRATRPEQIVLLGLIGFVAFGLPYGYAFLVLAILALLGRVAWASRRFVLWLGG